MTETIRAALRAATLSCALAAALSPRAAGAQDMVFTTDEVGGGPAAAIDGPPSEAMANALRLYQREAYSEAAVQFSRVVSGETQDAPAQLQKAQFFLGKALFHLRYYRTALAIFDEITQAGASHGYFEPALPWLAQLATELPEPAGTIALVGRYSPAQIATLERPETAEVHDHLRFLAARHAFAEGDLNAALQGFMAVPSRSSHRAHARFFAGITNVRLRQARPAIAAFRDVLAAVDAGGAPEPDRMRDLAWISLARVYYTAANRTDAEGERTVSPEMLASASEAWDRVSTGSELWLDALFEQSWAMFLAGQESRAMGNVHALFSPYFEGAYYPEALVLKAVIFFSACQLDNTRAIVGLFHDRYDPVREQLEALLGRFEDHEQLYRFVVDVARGQADVPPRIRGIVRGALTDRTLLRHLELVRLLDAEQARLDAAPLELRDSSLGDRIRQEVLVSRSFAVDQTGDIVRQRSARLIDELDELMNQIDTVEVELLRLEREGLTSPSGAAPLGTGGNVEVDEEHQRWIFDGEYWRDELPFYRQQVSDVCQR